MASSPFFKVIFLLFFFPLFHFFPLTPNFIFFPAGPPPPPYHSILHNIYPWMKQKQWYPNIVGGHPTVYGPRGAGGCHQFLPRRLPTHRHVRVRPGALGDCDAVPRYRAGHALPAALRGRGLAPSNSRGNMRSGGTSKGMVVVTVFIFIYMYTHIKFYWGGFKRSVEKDYMVRFQSKYQNSCNPIIMEYC